MSWLFDRDHPLEVTPRTAAMTHNSNHLDSSPQNQKPEPRSSWGKPLTYLSLMLFGAGLATAGHYVGSNPELFESKAIAQVNSQNSAILPGNSPSSAAVSSNFISDVVESAGPAVVRINASRTVTTQLPEGMDDPFLRRFFGFEGQTGPMERVQRGVGSGFIINQDGHILTNAHVVAGADRVEVTLRDGRALEGQVLGADPATDVAVVKVDADNLPTVPISDSEQIRPGQWAIAIGNPLGLDNTVTVGIISATGRSSGQVGVPDKRVEFIQTDTAINPGNSGGPLLNERGEVIGMNTAIIQGAQGIGFSIPINAAKAIAEQLIATGKVEHTYLGIQMVDVTPELKAELNGSSNGRVNITEDEGVLVAGIMPNSPAAQAGLQQGDVIKEIDNQPVMTSEAVQKIVAAKGVGDQLRLEVVRNQQNLNLVAQLGALPAEALQ
jgi:serine protease Do